MSLMSKKYKIGVDVGGTNVKVALVDKKPARDCVLRNTRVSADDENVRIMLIAELRAFELIRSPDRGASADDIYITH